MSYIKLTATVYYSHVDSYSERARFSMWGSKNYQDYNVFDKTKRRERVVIISDGAIQIAFWDTLSFDFASEKPLKTP